jgi:hypothetical protein
MPSIPLQAIQSGGTRVPTLTFSGTTPIYYNPPNGQHVIPRYANGVTHPAGMLIGTGPACVVQATNDTLTRTIKAVVCTEDYDKPTQVGMWQGATTPLPSVMRATVRDITIAGRDIQNYDSTTPGGGLNYHNTGEVSDAPGYNTAQGAQKGTIIGASSAEPIVITTHATLPAAIADGDVIRITQVRGLHEANGMWRIAGKTSNSFQLVGSDGSQAASRPFAFQRTVPITSASSGTPIVITTESPHFLLTGQVVVVSGVTGNTAANGPWVIEWLSSTTFRLNGSNGSAGAGTGGSVGLATGEWAWANSRADAVAYNGGASGTITATASQPPNHYPVRCTTSSTAGLFNGAWVQIRGCTDSGRANGWREIVNVTATTFDIVAFGKTTSFDTVAQTEATWACPHAGFPDRFDGLDMASTGAEVTNVGFLCIPGTAANITRHGSSSAKAGGQKIFDNVVFNIDGLWCARVYRGFQIRNIDGHAGKLHGNAFRDFGLRVGATVKGNEPWHFWGGDTGATIIVDGDGVWHGGVIYPESHPMCNMLVDGFDGFYNFIHMRNGQTEGLTVNGTTNYFNRIIHSGTAPTVVVAINNQYNTIASLDIPTTAENGVGLRISGGEHFELLDGRIVVAAGGVGVDVPADFQLLADSKIHVHVNGVAGSLGVRLRKANNTSALAGANDIRINSPQYQNSGPTRIVELPTTWEPTNKIVVNGIRVKGIIASATAANPIVCTTVSAHGLASGTHQIFIGDGVGLTGLNTPLNTLTTVTQTSGTGFSIATAGTGTYSANTAWWGVPE